MTIQEFMPIYGALKKDHCPVSYDQLVGCLTNFEREQEGFIMEADLRNILENMGKNLDF
jgi:Ca2+-binding EF-hand superfamily protein